MPQKLMAGVSSVDITPARGLELAGYPHAPRHNTGVHDPLFATCLYLDDGDTRLAVVGLDILFFSKKHVDAVRGRVEALTGIPAKNIMFSCSHSHSTPWASGRLDLEALESGVTQDEGLISELCEKLTHLVVSASRTAFAASIAFGTAICGREQGVGGNRRDPENGPCDPNVYAMAVRDEVGTVRCTFVNYAVHPTVLHADNTLCSGDYVGALRRRLREDFPHSAMVFGLGASGDQSTRYFRTAQTFTEADRIGCAMADAARMAIEAAVPEEAPKLHVKTARFDPGLRELPTRAEAEMHLIKRKAELETLIKAGAPYVQTQSAHVNLLGAEDILGYILMRERGLPMELIDDELPAEISVFGIGDVRMLGLPGEIFMAVALEIRRVAGLDKLIINTVTNGCLPGYCYTAEDAALGGYEIDTSMLNEDAGTQLAAEALKLLRRA